MKKAKIKLLTIAMLAGLAGGCGSDDSGGAYSVTIDGVAYGFNCFRTGVTGYEYHVSCDYNESKRLDFMKSYDVNGGEIILKLTDVPDPTLFDSPYGIEYQCSNLDNMCISNTPEFDSVTGTLSATDVVLPQRANNTGTTGATEHTVSFSVVPENVAFFQ